LDEGDGSIGGVEVSVISTQNAGAEDDGVLVLFSDVVDTLEGGGQTLKVQSESTAVGVQSVHLRGNFDLSGRVDDEFDVR